MDTPSDWPTFTPESLALTLEDYASRGQEYVTRARPPADGEVRAAQERDSSLYDAYANAYVYLRSGLDHMTATVHALRGEPRPYFADYTLSRAVLEAAARAYWLLEPGLGTGQRIARALLDRVDSILNHRNVVPETDPGHAKTQAYVRRRIGAIKQQAAKHHLHLEYVEADKKRRESCSVGKTRRPGPTAAVDHLLRWVYDEQDSQTWFYSHLSGFAHSSMYAFIEASAVINEDRSGFRTLQVQMDMVRLSTTVIACAHAHSHVLRHYGLAADVPDSPSITLFPHP